MNRQWIDVILHALKGLSHDHQDPLEELWELVPLLGIESHTVKGSPGRLHFWDD
jgi:hypothetical protein